MPLAWKPLRIAVIALAGLLATAPSLAAEPKIGTLAPAFSLRDREGSLVSLADFAYPGQDKPRRPRRVVVLDFFRTDCKPCREGLAKLIALHQRFKDRGVHVLLIALLEEDEGQEKLDRFVAARKLTVPILVDSYGVVGKKYVFSGGRVRIPALFVIDRRGALRGRFTRLDDQALSTLNQLLTDLSK